jgi:Tfp pilus assembly protein PilO
MSIANKNYLGVGLAGLAVIIFWIFAMPIWDRTSLLNTAIAERGDILSLRKEVLKKIEELNIQYQERSSDVDKISSVVPNAKNAAELVSTIEAITQQTGMQLIEITMGESSAEQQELQTVFLNLGLIGSYPSLTTFLELVEKNIRLIDVQEISVSQTSTPGAQVVLNFRVKASAYYLK